MKKFFALPAVLLMCCLMPLSAAPMKAVQAVPFCPANRPGASFQTSGTNYSVLLDKKTGMFGQWTLTYKLSRNTTACQFQAEHDAGEDAVVKGLVVCSASWLDEDGKNIETAYMEPESAETFRRVLRRPEGAEKVAITVGIRHLFKKVTFKDIVCEPVELSPRPVRIVTAKIASGDTVAENLARMEKVWQNLEKAGEKPDLIVFPETMLTRGVRNLPLAKAAQSIPGPHTDWAANWAKKMKTNVVVSLLEEKDGRYYISAAVIDRAGKLLGVYRKTHLAHGEYEAGIAWGKDLPVFELDFGKVGVLICRDLWFPETARLLRMRGAEVIAYPIAAANRQYMEHMWRARAMENGVVLAASISGGADCPSRIILPDGEMLTETYVPQTYAAGTVDLNDLPLFLQYLSVGRGAGETRSFYIYERHPELYRILSDKH